MDQSTARIGAPPADAMPPKHRRAEYDGHKPLREIEEDIARTRIRLGTTITALEGELTPARFVERGTEALGRSLKLGAGPLRDQFRAYAIPLAMILAGLAWLVASRRNNWEANLPSEFGEMPAEAVEIGETARPDPAHAGLAEPLEPVSLTDSEATS
jgi:Protein of unknown function (DUF3618)